MSHLFQSGDFTLHSGQHSRLKINCDALTDADWETLAAMIAEQVMFSSVSGVPKGGLKLASILKRYISKTGPHLVVDDVLTTGSSIVSKMNKYKFAIGFVVFARGPLPVGVYALWKK